MTDLTGKSGSFADLKERFRPATVEARICFDGGLAAEIDRLEAELAQATVDDDRLNREAVAPAIADRIVALTDELRAAEQTFTIAAVSRRAWAELLDEHPPSDEDREDGRDFGATFPIAAIAACSVEPKLTEDDVEWLAEHLSLGQFLRLQNACIAVNRGLDGLGKAPSDTALRLATERSSTTAHPTASPSASFEDES